MSEDIRVKLAQHATAWKFHKGIHIEERWNPKDALAKIYPNPHPNKDQPLFAILNFMNMVWSKKEVEFIIEPIPSSRTDEFILNTRFTLEEAYEIIQSWKRNMVQIFG